MILEPASVFRQADLSNLQNAIVESNGIVLIHGALVLDREHGITDPTCKRGFFQQPFL